MPFRAVMIAMLFGCNICLYCSRAVITVAVVYMFPSDDKIEGQAVGLRFDTTRLHFFGADEQRI